MRKNDVRMYHRIYLTRDEDRLFQVIANMLWKGGVIAKPTISKFAKMSLNDIAKQYLALHAQMEAKENKLKNYLAKQRAPIKTVALNPVKMDEQWHNDYF